MPTSRLGRLSATLTVLVAALAVALIAPAGGPARSAPPPLADHRLSSADVDRFATRIGPGGRALLRALATGARAEVEQAERDGRIGAGARAHLERCLERGECGAAGAERALDVVVDGAVTKLVERSVQPALEDLLGP